MAADCSIPNFSAVTCIGLDRLIEFKCNRKGRGEGIPGDGNTMDKCYEDAMMYVIECFAYVLL